MFGNAIREQVNGSLLPLSWGLLFMISVYLFYTYKLHGRGWTDKPGVATACALWWLFAADGLRSGAAWIFLRFTNMGFPVAQVTWYTNIIYMIAGSTLFFALLRLCYLFTPPAWGHRGWLWVAAITGWFLIASQALKSFGW